MMMITQETIREVSENIIRILPVPHDQYAIVGSSEGWWTVTNSQKLINNARTRKKALGEDDTVINVIFYRRYFALETMIIGNKHKGQGCESKIIDLLLQKSKELSMPLVVMETEGESIPLVESKELKESVTRMDTTTSGNELKIFVISESALQKEHEAVVTEIRECYLDDN